MFTPVCSLIFPYLFGTSLSSQGVETTVTLISTIWVNRGFILLLLTFFPPASISHLIQFFFFQKKIQIVLSEWKLKSTCAELIFTPCVKEKTTQD